MPLSVIIPIFSCFFDGIAAGDTPHFFANDFKTFTSYLKVELSYP